MVIENPGTSQRIVRDPEIHGGKPVLAGTRMGVHTIVGYHRLYGGDLDRILREFPALTRDAIMAALNWCELDPQHQAEIDAILREQHVFYEAGLAAQRKSREGADR
jgi:uncharacterized protein (DUF433 family)